MSFMKKVDAIKIEYHEPTSITLETHTIVNNKITLNQIPDRVKKVVIDGLTELVDHKTPLGLTNFRVDYNIGLVTFHPVSNGSNITISQYYGRGVILYPASRIYSDTNEAGVVTRTLQDIIDVGDTNVDIITQTVIDANQATTIANQAATNADLAKDRANHAADIVESIDTLIDYDGMKYTTTVLVSKTENGFYISEDGKGDYLLCYGESGNPYLKPLYMTIGDTQPTDGSSWLKVVG